MLAKGNTRHLMVKEAKLLKTKHLYDKGKNNCMHITEILWLWNKQIKKNRKILRTDYSVNNFQQTIHVFNFNMTNVWSILLIEDTDKIIYKLPLDSFKFEWLGFLLQYLKILDTSWLLQATLANFNSDFTASINVVMCHVLRYYPITDN